MESNVLSKIKNKNIHEILNLVNYRTRIVLQIKNKKTYVEHVFDVKYDYLRKKYKGIIDKGVDQTGERTNNNIIWMCWLQGIENAPSLVQSCVRSIKVAAKNSAYEVIVLSEDTIPNYIDLPEYIIKKRKSGIISHAHFTDIVRTELLCRYGGGWIDATVLCTSERFPDCIINSKLFFFQDINWGNIDYASCILSSWLIFSESNNPILLLTRELLHAYWKDYRYLIHYFLFHLFFTMSAARYQQEWLRVPVYSNEPPRIMSRELNNTFDKERWEQIIRMTDIHKLNWKNENTGETTIMRYVLENY